MSVSINDIKKLPAEEKLRIIEELWDSIDDDIVERELISEEDLILGEREQEYKNDTSGFKSWDEVKKRLNKNSEDRQKDN